MKTLSQKINDWMGRPMGNADPGPAALIAVIFLSFLSWTRLDSDSFYMIAQGRDILANGIPYEHPFSYYEGAAIVVQQWPYCVAEYLASRIPYNLGLWLFMAVQAAALYLLVKHVLSRHVKDEWVSCIVAVIISVVPVMPYFYSCRPENLTLIILILEALALEKYRGTGNARWLISLPLLMLAEINVHGSMWIFHFCILAAYVVPPVLKSRMKDNHIKLDRNVALAATAMFPAMLLNPYGIDMPLYVFRSMKVFDYVPIVEQASTGVFSSYGFQVVMCTVILALMLSKKKASSVTTYISAGFLLLASMQYHSCMFLTLVYLWICRDALDWFESLSPARFKDAAPNALKAMWSALAAVAVIVSVPYGYMNLPLIDRNPKMDDAVSYVLEHQQPGENVLNMLDTGSILDYAGVTGIQSDTRPELMLRKINHVVDAELEYHWLYNGVNPDDGLPEHEDLAAYLDHYNIQYIIDQVEHPAFRYLAGWLSDNPDWTLADLGETDPLCTFGVWVRTEAAE